MARKSFTPLAGVSGECPPLSDSPLRTGFPSPGQDAFMPVLSRSSDKPLRLVYVRSTSDPNLWRVDVPASVQPRSRNLFRPSRRPCSMQIPSSRQMGSEWRSNRRDPARSRFGSRPSRTAPILHRSTTMNAQTPAPPRWSPDGQTDRLLIPTLRGNTISTSFPLLAARPTAHDVRAQPMITSPAFPETAHRIYFSSNRTGVMEIWRHAAQRCR